MSEEERREILATLERLLLEKWGKILGVADDNKEKKGRA